MHPSTFCGLCQSAVGKGQKLTARWPGFNSFLSQLLAQIEKHFQALAGHGCRLVQRMRSLGGVRSYKPPPYQQHLVSASITHVGLTGFVLPPSSSDRQSGHDLSFPSERCPRIQQASSAALFLVTYCFRSQFRLVTWCGGSRLPRSRSGAHADAQDDEAAAADEAFDFPRFVLPLFRDEAQVMLASGR